MSIPHSRVAPAWRDALVAMAAATHHPANVVDWGDSSAICVEFECNRYLLATQVSKVRHEDPDAAGGWSVQLRARTSGGDELLARAESEWLSDALDVVLEKLHGAVSIDP